MNHGLRYYSHTGRLGEYKVIYLCKEQDSHRLKKYLNLEGFLEKFLKIQSALKSTGNHSKAMKSP